MSGKAKESLRSPYYKFWSFLKSLWQPSPVAQKSDDTSHEIISEMQKEMLQTITLNGVDLDKLYGQTLEMIRKQKGDLPRLGMKVLMWVSHSKRPLRWKELQWALSLVDPEARNIYPKDAPSQEAVLGSCLGLVMVEKHTLRVRLIHNTLQQYLSQPGILFGAHRQLGETCIAFLNHRQVKRIRARKIEDLVPIPFLEYASLYWVTHAKVELSDTAKTLAVDLLQNFENHISFDLFCKKDLWHYFSNPRHPFTGLHLASFLGIEGLVAAMLTVKSCDINKKYSSGYTPLMRAVRHGNHGAARLLLTCNGVDPDRPAPYETPLIWAINHGDDEMVRVLIKGGSDPTRPDKHGETPLMAAPHPWNERKAALFQLPPIAISDLD